ncbi:hypothetical protein V8B97DRAFT_1322910 [Scleroderma yunnanense]
MRLGDHAASILVDGKVTVSPSAAQATCWVALEAGKICVTTSRGGVKVDGTHCSCGYIYPGCLGQQNTMCSSPIVYGTKKRDIVFYNLELSGTCLAFRLYISKLPRGRGTIGGPCSTAFRKGPPPNFTTKRHEKTEKNSPVTVLGRVNWCSRTSCVTSLVVGLDQKKPAIVHAGMTSTLHPTRIHPSHLSSNTDWLTNGIAPQYSDIPLDIAVPKNDTSAVLGRITLSEICMFLLSA